MGALAMDIKCRMALFPRDNNATTVAFLLLNVSHPSSWGCVCNDEHIISYHISHFAVGKTVSVVLGLATFARYGEHQAVPAETRSERTNEKMMQGKKRRKGGNDLGEVLDREAGRRSNDAMAQRH